MDRKEFAVCYRTGGTHNFKWRKVLDVFTINEAREMVSTLTRQGYLALIHKASMLNSIGLPETYEASSEVK